MNAQTYTAPIYPTLDQLPVAGTDRHHLAALLDQTLDALPDDSALDALPAIAAVLVGETLAGCARKGLFPKSAQAGLLIACQEALRRLPEAASVSDFRAAAKAALLSAI